MIHWMPGAVNRTRERGDKDYRLDAVLDLHQFRKLMIVCVLDHNKHHEMKWYRMDEFMIQDYVEPYPIELWNWGVRNRSGHIRLMAPKIVRLNLLPASEASVTHRGIRFRSLLYTCDLAQKEQWFVKARQKGTWRIPIAYEPRRLDTIYLRLDDGRRLEPCQLLEIEKAFKGRDWHEAVDYVELRKQDQEATKTRQHQARADFHSNVEQIVLEAQEQTEKALVNQDKQSRIQGIRGNRQLERESERERGAWQLGVEEIPGQHPEQIIPIPLPVVAQPKDDEKYVPPHRPFDKLRSSRQRKLNDDSE